MDKKPPMTAAERQRLSRQRKKEKEKEMTESEVAVAKQAERERIAKAVKKTRDKKIGTMSSEDLKAYKLSESARINNI